MVLATPKRPRPLARGRLERQWTTQGLRMAGVDEVGRGCLAGPVYAGCVVIDWQRFKRLPASKRALIRDSKRLSAAQRSLISPTIIGVSECWHVSSASSSEIDQLGIVAATFLSMHRAIAGCHTPFDLLLIDGKWPLPHYAGRQEAIIKGDDLCFSIAAASILAKQARDSYMQEQAGLYPAYGFAEHVGYGTQRHLASISAHGICPLHRKSFAPIRAHARTDSPASPDHQGR